MTADFDQLVVDIHSLALSDFGNPIFLCTLSTFLPTKNPLPCCYLADFPRIATISTVPEPKSFPRANPQRHRSPQLVTNLNNYTHLEYRTADDLYYETTSPTATSLPPSSSAKCRQLATKPQSVPTQYHEPLSYKCPTAGSHGRCCSETSSKSFEPLHNRQIRPCICEAVQWLYSERSASKHRHQCCALQLLDAVQLCDGTCNGRRWNR